MTASKSRDCRDSAHSPIVFSEHGKRLAGEAIAYYDSEVVPVIRARPDEVAAIYFIGTISRLKIGLARRDVDQRLTSIQAMSPEEIDVYACVLGTLAFERKLHAIFDEFRAHGEWFDLTEESMDGLSLVMMYAARFGQREHGISLSVSVPCDSSDRRLLSRPMRHFPHVGASLSRKRLHDEAASRLRKRLDPWK